MASKRGVWRGVPRVVGWRGAPRAVGQVVHVAKSWGVEDDSLCAVTACGTFMYVSTVFTLGEPVNCEECTRRWIEELDA